MTPALNHKPDGRLVVRTAITLDPKSDRDIIQAINEGTEAGMKLAAILRELMRNGTTEIIQAAEVEIDLTDLGEEI